MTNWSRPGRLTAYLPTFHVSYASDPVVVRDALMAAAVSHDGVLDDPAPEVEFQEVGATTLLFQLQVWSTDYLKNAGTLKSDLNFAVWRELAGAGIAIQPRESTMANGVDLRPAG